MKRIGLAVGLALVFLTGCLPQMNGGGWGWDPSPGQPIVVDTSSGLAGPGQIETAAAKMNWVAGTTIMIAGAVGPAAANVDFQVLTPICANGNCNDRRQMWVYATYQGQPSATQAYPGAFYADHCTVFYDPTMWWVEWSADVIWHELWHCLMYPDVTGPTDYRGILSYQNFWDPAWRAQWWGGADDRAMLARDGYGP